MILLWYKQDPKRGLRALAAAHCHLEDLGVATSSSELQIALGAVDFPEQIRAA